ncbi:pirin family protein [Sphingopyxis terrae subsp. ummariensis]
MLNEDRVVPGAGFPEHGHEDMEIVTIVLKGAIKHRDNLGNNAIIRSGEVQRMSAGIGIRHSAAPTPTTPPIWSKSGSFPRRPAARLLTNKSRSPTTVRATTGS